MLGDGAREGKGESTGGGGGGIADFEAVEDAVAGHYVVGTGDVEVGFGDDVEGGGDGDGNNVQREGDFYVSINIPLAWRI